MGLGVPVPCSTPAAAWLPPGPAHLDGFVEDAVPDLDHLQVLLLLVPCTLDVGHPAAVVLLAGIDEVPHRAILVEDLAGEREQLVEMLPKMDQPLASGIVLVGGKLKARIASDLRLCRQLGAAQTLCAHGPGP